MRCGTPALVPTRLGFASGPPIKRRSSAMPIRLTVMVKLGVSFRTVAAAWRTSELRVFDSPRKDTTVRLRKGRRYRSHHSTHTETAPRARGAAVTVMSMRALVSRMHAHAFALFERAVEERHCAWWVPARP